MADSINPNANKGKGSEFLPRIFRSDSNKKFLQATIDQLTQPGTVKKVNGYIGRQNAKAVSGPDTFLAAPTKSRQDYQLEPGLIVNDTLGNTTFFKDYQDYINQLDVFGGNVKNHARLNAQEMYSWDPHIDWDKFVNFQNYYWLPFGPDVIKIAGQQEKITSTYNVTIESELDSNAYIFSEEGSQGLVRNPTIKLYKGQTYKFNIDSPNNPFSIKRLRTPGSLDRYQDPGITGVAVTSGTITFTVPYSAPDVLYYVSETDADLGGVFQVLSIDENTSIDVESEIIGKAFYTLADGTQLSNGMLVSFIGKVSPESYASSQYYVEGVGTSIRLIDERLLQLVSQYTDSEAIKFDTTPFDSMPFSDATSYAGSVDYIVINRASKDHSPWSRYNRWFHKDVIETSAKYNGKVPSLDQTKRAVRPIIEFEADLRLFNFGNTAIDDVDLVDTYTTDVFSSIEGQLGYNIDGIDLAQGQRILFVAATDRYVKNNIYRVEFRLLQGIRRIHLKLETEPVDGNVVLVKQGNQNQGEMYWYDGTSWNLGQQKTKLNQQPMFDVVNSSGVSYGDASVYDGTTFTGTPVFSYKVGTGTADSNLGFALSYKNISNIGDIVFNFNLINDTFLYKDVSNVITYPTSVGYLKKTTPAGTVYVNGWQKCTASTLQAAVRIYKNTNKVNNFKVDIFDNVRDLADLVVRVYINGVRLEANNWSLVDGTVYKTVVLNTDITTSDVLTIKAFAAQPINSNGYYEIPVNLQNNPLNNALTEFTLGEVIDHVNSIVDNLPGFSGIFPGASNIRDLGNVTQFGVKFVQHSGLLSLALYHVTSEDNNVIRAIEKAREEYNKFKRNFITIAETLGVDADVVTQVDLILEKINKDKPTTAPYYFSDMVPYGAKTITDLTVVDYRIKTYPLTSTFSLDELSTRAVCVYLNGTQLLHEHDYVFNSQGFVVITGAVNLQNDDTITIHEYDNTNGCFVPQTPSKLGIWPTYDPKIYVDTSYLTPRTMIQGHDGSILLGYGDYRDNLLLELEKRIYNNIKVKYNPDIFDIYDVLPGYNRTSDYSLEEFDEVLAPSFYKWTTLIDRDFTKPLSYDRDNPITYNYRGHVAPDGRETPGYWRGIYRWMLDTDRPNLCPWEMLGFCDEPIWWTTAYGPAPYTSDNLPMWQDLSDGIVREPGKPIVVLEKFKRPFLINHIPVDEQGNITSPLYSGLSQGIITTSTSADYVFGDVSPVESAWRRSSFYPFSVLLAAMILQPAKTFGTLLDRSRIIRNVAGQLIYKDTGLRIRPQDVKLPSIYSSSSNVQTAGIINYLVDYILSDNLKSYTEYSYDLVNLDARISHRIGGFTSKEKFNLLLDSKTPLSQGSVFVPQENYDIVLNTSSPVKKITYSGVIITKVSDGFEVKGYSKSQPYFKYYAWTQSGITINVGGISEEFSPWTSNIQYAAGKIVQYNNRYYRSLVLHTTTTTFDPKNYQALQSLPIIGGKNASLRRDWDREDAIVVPYGTKFRTIQEVVDFLLGYGEWLKDQGFIFDEFNTTLGAVTNWETSAKEFLFWTTQNWSSGEDKWEEWLPNTLTTFGSIVRFNGDYYRAIRNSEPSATFTEDDFVKLDGLSTVGSSVISLSPAAAKLTFSAPLMVVDDIRNAFNTYEIYKVDGSPIAPNFLNSYREDNAVSYIPRDDDGIYGASFYLVQKEQVVILNNTTIFNDTIYHPASGYKQDRIKVAGYVSSEWTGAFNVPGFIFDQAIIKEWAAWTDYALGDIVKYKEFYYSAKTFLLGVESFDYTKWVKLDKKPTPQLIPNWTYKAEQFTDFYSLDSDNFDVDQQAVAQHLVGYQKRQYLSNIIKDDVSEFKFYQGMIVEKGTQNVLNKLFDVLSADNKESLTFYEEWALRVGQYGANQGFENIEFVLDEAKFKSNPQGFELVNSVDSSKVDFIYRQTPNDVYLKPLGYNNNPWPVTSATKTYLRTPGHVRENDVKLVLASISDIVNHDSSTFVSGDYVWCGFEGASWNVYRYTDADLIVTDVTYSNSVLTLVSDRDITIPVGSYIGISQVTGFTGFYKVETVSLNKLTVKKSGLTVPTPFVEQDSIIVFVLTTQKSNSIDDAESVLPKVINKGELLWTGGPGTLESWTTWKYDPVYTKSELINYTPADELLYGRHICLNASGNIAIISNALGELTVYDKASPNSPWIQRQTVVPPFITILGGFDDPLLVNALTGDVIAVSTDGRWLATGTPAISSVCAPPTWDNALTYTTGNVVKYGSSYYRALQDVAANIVPTVTSSYWTLMLYTPVDSGGANSSLFEQGAISLYEKDANNIFTLVDTIISPYPADLEKFGSSVAFGNNTLFISAPGNSSNTGRVYQMNYEVRVQASSSYNPTGSVNTTIKVANTAGIKSGMAVRGSGFASGQVVVSTLSRLTVSSIAGISVGMKVTGTNVPANVVVTAVFSVQDNDVVTNYIDVSAPQDLELTISSATCTLPESLVGVTVSVTATTSLNTLIVSAAPDSEPAGVLDFTLTSWGYVAGTGLEATTSIGSYFGSTLSISKDSSTLLVSAAGLTQNGNVFVYKNNNNDYSLTQTITGDNIRFGQSTSVSDTGAYIAVSSVLYDAEKIDQGQVLVYKANTSGYNTVPEQVLTDHYPEIAGMFGAKIAFMNDYDTLVVFSANADNYEILSLDAGLTTFDVESTRFVTPYVDSGRVDVYDRYRSKWVHSEHLENSSELNDGLGYSIAVAANHIFISAPYADDQTFKSGKVYEYSKVNNTYSWSALHTESNKPDVSKIKKAFLYNKVTNKLISYIDVVDPLQGKIPGIADQEIKYKTFYDPATYSVGTGAVNVDDGMAWESSCVGMLWWDLSTAKFIDSYDSDVVYRNSTWNTLFPGASIDVYEWVESTLLPTDWDAQADTEEGIALGISGTSLYGNNAYSVVRRYDNVSKTFKNKYYYWVKNKKTVPNVLNRYMSAQDVADLISNPRGAGYRYLALSGSNSFSLVNVVPVLDDANVVLSVEYWTIDNSDQNIHSQWKLISNNSRSEIPSSIEDKWFDSLCGKDSADRSVPDLTQPIKLRYGIENRPRQSMFVNRFEALKQLIEQANRLLIQHQIVEQRNISNLETYEAEPSTITGLYDTVIDTDAELRFVTPTPFVRAEVLPIVVDGRITSVDIINKGRGYLTDSFITVSGKGTGAILKTKINATGQVTGVEIISEGMGYNADTTTLSVRSYCVLVHTDSAASGNWSIYSYEVSTRTWSRIQSQSYDTRNYWSYVDWYATGYNQFTAVDYAVDTFAELLTISPTIGQTVKIRTTNSGNWMLLEKDAESTSVDWTQSYKVVGSQNGTIQFDPTLYQFTNTAYGYDGSLYDNTIFDNSASKELRVILTTLRDNILIDDLKSAYLDLFFTSVRYALSEQTYVDWIFKTSFVNAQHNVGGLHQPVTYNNDNLSDFEAYVDEVKPYRTKIREYVSSYAKLDNSLSSVTDFDLPSAYENNQLVPVTVRIVDGVPVSDNTEILSYPWKHWLDNVGFKVTELKLFDGGSGYISEPVVRFVSNSGSGATARAFISNGKVNRIVLLTPGSGYLSAPTVIVDGGLSDTGVAARAVAVIGDSVVRSNLIKMKYDRITQTYFITQLQETQSFTGTGSRQQFALTWSPDIRIGQSTVTIDGVEALRDTYKLSTVKSTSKGYTSYSGALTFDTAPAINANIRITYLKDWNLLNAADRIQYYYNPTTGSLGKDLTQLMTGVDYGGVIVNGLGFDTGFGWSSVPYYADKWDSFDATFDDYIATVTANTHSFTLPYTPAADTLINVYHVKLNAESYTSNGTDTTYTFNVKDVSPKVVATKSTVIPTSSVNVAGSTVLRVTSTTGVKVGDIVTITPYVPNTLGFETKVTQIVNGTDVKLDQILFNDVPGASTATFTRELIVPTDCTIYGNGTVVLTDPLVAGTVITISSLLSPVRIDDSNFGTVDQTNDNAVMTTWIADGESTVVSIPDTFVVGTGDQFILRKSTSDGSIAPQDADFDTALSGGNLAYTSATGLRAEDILVDGDGFVTPTSSPAPEEVVPGQVVDAVAIKVYDRPSSGSANIKVDNYTADGEQTEFKISQQPNSPTAVVVKFTAGARDLITDELSSISEIKTTDVDFTVDYRTSTVVFDTAPPAGQLVSIFSFGFNGSNILDLDYFVGDGTVTEFITKAPWQDDLYSLVYIDGQPAQPGSPELFRTDSSYENADRVGIRFSVAPTDNSLINFVIVSGTEQTFAVTQTERIAATGTDTYNLSYSVGDSLPVESNMIVRVGQEILNGPNNSYFTIKSNRLNYTLDPTKFLPYSVAIDDILVFAAGILLTPGVDYITDMSGITIKINKLVYKKYSSKALVISVKRDQGYFYIPATDVTPAQIKLSQSYSSPNFIEVISSYKHDILDVQRTAINVTSSFALTPDTVEYYHYTNVSGGKISLDRSVINDSYVWVIKNGTLLTPSADYRLNDDKISIQLALLPEANDQFTMITYSSNVLTSGIAYMQFKDMLNRVHFKRLSLNKQTRLVTQLNYNDLTIEVEDASNFDIPNPAQNKPGVVEIKGERIEYFTINGNVLGQLRRGTLGTGVLPAYRAGTIVQDIGPAETMPYTETAIIKQVVSDGTNIVKLDFAPSKSTTEWTYEDASYTSSIPDNYGQCDDVEVFVGGYGITEAWTAKTSYTEGAFVIVGSYTYKCTTSHVSSQTFAADSANWEFFIGNIRLKKSPYTVHNVNQSPYSPEGDVQLDADFSVNGTSNEIRLTTELAFGTQVTVVKRTGVDWDSTVNIQNDSSKIARFLKATPGIWYTESRKYQAVSTFDSTTATWDSTGTTFDQG